MLFMPQPVQYIETYVFGINEWFGFQLITSMMLVNYLESLFTFVVTLLKAIFM